MSCTIYVSSTCTRCGILKDKLKNCHVNFKESEYSESEAMDILKKNKIFSFPALEFEDGTFMDFSKAIMWINGGCRA